MKELFDQKPLIGILTIQKSDGSLAGNESLFVSIQQDLLSKGGISVVFTPEGLSKKEPKGYLYWPEKQKWLNVQSPLPHVVYNRIPSREAERTPEVLNVIAKLIKLNIPYFNPHFLDKILLYACLERSSQLKHYLPDTILIKTKEMLYSFLREKKQLYLKPSLSSQGKGIYRVRLVENQQIHLVGLDRDFYYDTMNEFWLVWSNQLLSQRYIAQQEIISSKINGQRFDFRILAHAKGSDQEYLVTGIGIRQSKRQDITTHLATGGTIIPYESIQTEEHDYFIEKVVQSCGKVLTEEFGFFGEFSIDATQSEEGNYYIFEINSKPMSFDEQSIERKHMDHLSQLFLELSGFNQ
jgi:glutathione synthase/RimK-type ligase-like ATP-grasp enzyme